ncbi:hypothetical protein GCM10011613_29090 [Cellvibrio zantedeschiae]|uniref:Glycosyl transferase family 1 domain-containing protein n=1 Tax=Cellvibrio zantedeschiae TaxID=1237077 RepID=A0ABQ3B7D0_9GAMM|nr:hypothetical protein GCM10011613_29090 [Cellvibrio zantedeschiae]
MLFYRDVQKLFGGHLKVADYFEHLASSASFVPCVSLSDNSRMDASNPWFGKRSVEYLPANYDYVFLAGMDWRDYLAVDHPPNQPVINLIQHVRHADPAEDVYQYLTQRAIRICVSQQVADAIQQTEKVKGPVFTIPNGVDLPDLSLEKSYDVIILGVKQPGLSREIHEQLTVSGEKVVLVSEQVPRDLLFEYLAASRVAILLPNVTEGFYLPALEAMKYCDLVIVPDCVGNRDFCKDNQNCLMPEYNLEAILASAAQAKHLLQNEHVLTVFKREMGETLRAHNLAKERQAFLEIMANVKKLWAM